jgi:hypothetical protein
MKRTLFVIVIVALGLGIGTVNAADLKTDAGAKKSGVFWDGDAKEERLVGTLVEKGNWLGLDKPIYFAKGSKSERSVNKVRVNTPPDLKETVLKLEHRHVAVSGIMECAMHYSPWTASCEMTVKEIKLIE